VAVDPTQPAQPHAAEPHAPLSSAPSSIPAGRIHDEIVRQSLDAILITDLDDVVEVWNPAAERLYGIPAADAVGQPLGTLVVSHGLDGRPLDSDAARATLLRDGVWRERLIHRPTRGRRAGEDVIVDAGITLLRAEDGTPRAMLGINRDVGLAHRLESEIATLALLGAATGEARTSAEVASASLDLLCRAMGADAGLVTSAGSKSVSAAR
jgi:PAS domain S-box-containing protein